VGLTFGRREASKSAKAAWLAGINRRQLFGGPMLRLLGFCLVTTMAIAPARAEPTAPAIFCATYPAAPACRNGTLACTLCHDATEPTPRWNAFGQAVRARLAAGDFTTELPRALSAVEHDDADGDGVENLSEILSGRSPSTAEAGAGEASEYDFAFAYRRVRALYCGRSPSYDELAQYQAGGDLKAKLHDALSECLKSEYWLETALPRLADKRIKPVAALGQDTKLVIAGYRPVLGDYSFDYRLWQYVLSEDRDARDLLRADYHVLVDAQGKRTTTGDNIPRKAMYDLAGGQPLWAEFRAGMITTQWFFAFNTMVSGLPRVTAAQAYRAYLGLDIANGEGLMPVPNEPSDVDHKGVKQERCAVCHATLDPLAYAFMHYEGAQGLDFGSYSSTRPTRLIADWDDAKQRPMLFAQPVTSLIDWAYRASESDQFKRNLANIFFQHALGRSPDPEELGEYDALWQSCVEDGYSANRLIHRLVDTHSFGAP
jgi:hypothetical protein